MRIRLILATICAALMLSGCFTTRAPKAEAMAPSPLCAVHVWRGLTPVRAYRLARVAARVGQPLTKADVYAGCDITSPNTFLIKGEEADAAAIVWLALQRAVDPIQAKSAADLEVGYSNFADNIGSIEVAASTRGKCAGQAGRCIVGVLDSKDVFKLNRNWSRETFTLVRDGEDWRLIDYNRDDRVIIT